MSSQLVSDRVTSQPVIAPNVQEFETFCRNKHRRRELITTPWQPDDGHPVHRVVAEQFPAAVARYKLFAPPPSAPHMLVPPRHTVIVTGFAGSDADNATVRGQPPTHLFVGGPSAMAAAALDVCRHAPAHPVRYVTSAFAEAAASNALQFAPRSGGPMSAMPSMRLHRQIVDRTWGAIAASMPTWRTGSAAAAAPLQTVGVHWRDIFFGWTTAVSTLQIIWRMAQQSAGAAWSEYWGADAFQRSPVMQERARTYSATHWWHALSQHTGRPLIVAPGDNNPFHCALELARTETEEHELTTKCAQLATQGMPTRRLTDVELQTVFGDQATSVRAGFLFQSDGHFASDVWEQLRDLVTRRGHQWQEGMTLRRLFVDRNDAGALVVKAAELENSEGSRELVHCDQFMASLGAWTTFTVDPAYAVPPRGIWAHMHAALNALRARVGLPAHIGEPITTLAGLSEVVLLDRSKLPLGLLPTLATGTTHITPIDVSLDGQYVLARVTTGVFAFSQTGVPASFGLAAHDALRALLPSGSVIAVVQAKACYRPLNGTDISLTIKLAENGVITSGPSHIGMTRAPVDAVSALTAIGQFSAQSGDPTWIPPAYPIQDQAPFIARSLGL